MFKKIIPIIIILSLTITPFVQVSQAAEEEATEFISCVAGGFIAGLIGDVLKDLLGSFISGVLGGGDEVPVIDDDVISAVNKLKDAYVRKEYFLDIVVRCAAKEILILMGKDITNIARTGGRDGGPAWVRNWRNFQLDAQYRGEDIFRGVLNSTNICDYFGDELKNLFGATKEANLTGIRTRINDFDSFQVKAGCTLPKDFDFEDYKKDFSGNGGWEAWSRLLEPQNNFYGSYFMSLGEADKQRAAEESADLNEAGPTGFTSVRGQDQAKRCLISSPYSEKCLIYNDILTPGGIITNSVSNAIKSELEWITDTDELSEIIANGINVLISRLWDLSNPNEGKYTVPKKTPQIPTPTPTPKPGTTPTPTPTPTPG